MQNGIVTLEKSLAISHEINIPYELRISTFTYLPQRNENASSPKNLYSNVYNSIIYNQQQLKTTNMRQINCGPFVQWNTTEK